MSSVSEGTTATNEINGKRKRSADHGEMFANNNFVHSTPKKRKIVAEETVSVPGGPLAENTPQEGNDESHVILRPCSVCNRRNRTVSNHNALFACSRCSNLLNQAQRALNVDSASFN